MAKEGLTEKLLPEETLMTSEMIAATTTLFSPRGPTVLCRTMKLYAVKKRSWRKKVYGQTLPEETLMTSEMIAAAQRTIVVADSSKFGKRSFARIGPLGSIQVLITDKEPPDDLAQALHEARVEVIIAPQERATRRPIG
jgi:hypothetical protein